MIKYYLSYGKKDDYANNNNISNLIFGFSFSHHYVPWRGAMLNHL
ncbi:MAG TPA: hypothetical protein VE524_09670 [Nitrososphaeraceae archaeon]|nr:hypothetical protein [Nitrososphaeraceae archaeon]